MKSLTWSLFRTAASFPFRQVLLLTSFCVIVGFLRVSLARVAYPYALDLIEEGILLQAWRVTEQMPVYLPPNADFVPQVYMPLYTWVGGHLLRFISFDFWPLRAISLLSTLLSAGLLSWIAWRHTNDKCIGFGTLALLLSGYRLVGGWYDLARVDPLFLLLSLAGMTAVVFGRKDKRTATLAGLLMGLSILTKQNGLLFTAVAGLYIFLVARQTAKYFFAALLITLSPLPLMEFSTSGWFSYYVIDIAYASPISLFRIWHTISRELFGGMGFLFFAASITAGCQMRKHGIIAWLKEPWMLFILAALIISVSGRASVGGNLNNLIPAFGLLCLAPALLYQRLIPVSCFREKTGDVIAALVLGQVLLGLLTHFPTLPEQLLPTASMKAAGDSLFERINAVDGDVMVLMHPSYAIRAGMPAHVHIQTLWHARRRGEDALPSDFVRRIETKQYEMIISDNSPIFEQEVALEELLNSHYRLEAILRDEDSPPTLNGPIVRPLLIYSPK